MTKAALFACAALLLLAACSNEASEPSPTPTETVSLDTGTAVAEESSDESVIWTGSIGDLPITLCFIDYEDSVSPGEAVYYYNSQLKPIRLEFDEEADAPKGEIRLVETLGYEGRGSGRWSIKAASPQAIVGTWSDGAKTLPIRLGPVPATVAEIYGTACEAAEFVEPMLKGGSRSEASKSLGDIVYTELTYEGPERFGDDAYFVRTFALNPVQAGDDAINSALARVMPDEKVDNFMGQCIGMNVVRFGSVGYLSETWRPTLITDDWVGVEIAGSSYCGGAHPNHLFAIDVFDRNSGTEADPSTWFETDALKFYEFEGEREAGQPRYVAGLSQALLERVIANWPADEGSADCTDSLEADMGWDLGIAREGVGFVPLFPHVLTPCVTNVVVPWGELEPFLSAEGRSVRDGLN